VQLPYNCAIHFCSGYNSNHEFIIAEFENHLDRIIAGRVLVIVTTRDISMVPPSLMEIGRLDEDVYFPIPSNSFRTAMLRNLTKAWKKQPTDTTLEEVAKQVPYLTLEELNQLCRWAYLTAFQRQIPSVSKIDTLRLNSVDLDALEILPEDWNASIMSFENVGQISAGPNTSQGSSGQSLQNVIRYNTVLH